MVYLVPGGSGSSSSIMGARSGGATATEDPRLDWLATQRLQEEKRRQEALRNNALGTPPGTTSGLGGTVLGGSAGGGGAAAGSTTTAGGGGFNTPPAAAPNAVSAAELAQRELEASRQATEAARQAAQAAGGGPQLSNLTAGRADTGQLRMDRTGVEQMTGGDPRQAAGAGPTRDEIDDLFAQAIERRLQGPRDTSEEAAYLEQQLQTALGQQLADSGARAGARGMGFSGAQQSIEGGLRAQAASEAARGRFDLEAGARGEEDRRFQQALGAHLGTVGLAQGERKWDLLADLLGGGGPTSEDVATRPGSVEQQDEDSQTLLDEGWELSPQQRGRHEVWTRQNPDTGEYEEKVIRPAMHSGMPFYSWFG